VGFDIDFDQNCSVVQESDAWYKIRRERSAQQTTDARSNFAGRPEKRAAEVVQERWKVKLIADSHQNAPSPSLGLENDYMGVIFGI